MKDRWLITYTFNLGDARTFGNDVTDKPPWKWLREVTTAQPSLNYVLLFAMKIPRDAELEE